MGGYPELKLKTDKWEAIWIVYKVFHLAEKRELPMEVSLKSGSLELIIAETAISLSKNPTVAASIGGLIGAVVTYLFKRKKKGRAIEIIGANDDALLAYALFELERILGKEDLSVSMIVSQKPTNTGLEVRLKDSRGREHICNVTREFRFSYNRSGRR